MVSLKGKEIASSCGRFGVRYGFSDPALQIFLRISLNSVDRVCVSHSVVSSSVTPGTVARRLLCPWDSPGKNTGVGCHALLPMDHIP